METLANLEAFVRSAEFGSFSEAARRLSLTPAAVSRNVAMLERNLGVRLFHRSTRKLTLTEAGETFRLALGNKLDGIQTAIAEVAAGTEEPAGKLKVSMAPTFGVTHILPLLPGFLTRYPRVKAEWHFENRQVDLVAEGYDAAIGGGFDLSPGLVARTLAPAHIVAVASPAYMIGRVPPTDPTNLLALDGIVMRTLQTGRIRVWTMRDVAGRQVAAPLSETTIVNDPNAMREAALLGLGVAMLAVPDVQPALDTGTLVRLVPRWWSDAGAISLYYSSRTLVPLKTRVFVDWIADSFKEQRLAERFAGSLAQ
ncbi:LysR family transcriptional regulator [Methylobacterium brachythecii]|uniref:DNA-binding transcriptional LysR family regulator n=1 Tax=Methylobacterium brachythecii TaxID=1176177 RepID=A0A7W6F6Z0_9HYPH|nr:LysR family transcriptional regulator [Methylobacterium brachythecii]MBB3902854.1 DNA-binding transcriptional LysR family regulator [Methylobacterium brachythecii]GLS43780.1 LysR family transcriptional regulator [Methylobacterium brachythecii]